MWELERQVEELVMKYLEDSGAVYVGADLLGLDYRCGRVHISVEEDFIAVNGRYSIDYYGGFEYVSADDKKVLGEYTFYFSESNRVQNALECFSDQEEV